MEHTEMDELFRSAVHNQESKAKLSEERMNELWNSVHRHENGKTLLFWKVACVILLFLSMGLGFQVIQSNSKVDELNIQLTQIQEIPAESEDYIAVKPTEEEVNRSKVIEKAETEIKVKYIEREKIVYQPKEVIVRVEVPMDSLKNEIAIRDRKIEMLTQKNSEVKEEEGLDKLSSYPMQVAFQRNGSEEPVPAQKESKVKFQLSLFNIQ